MFTHLVIKAEQLPVLISLDPIVQVHVSKALNYCYQTKVQSLINSRISLTFYFR